VGRGWRTATPEQREVLMREFRTLLDYRLEKTSTGWKIYDVSILGVSLVQSFRDQFASEIDQHGVAGLINALRNRNKQLAAGER
jgi:phospholipid transport system substrate-binding protein